MIKLNCCTAGQKAQYYIFLGQEKTWQFQNQDVQNHGHTVSPGPPLLETHGF